MIVLYNNYGYQLPKIRCAAFFPRRLSVKNQDFIGISINPRVRGLCHPSRAPSRATAERVEEPGEVRAALQRGLKAIAGGQMALIDIRLAKAAETNERPDRAELAFFREFQRCITIMPHRPLENLNITAFDLMPSRRGDSRARADLRPRRRNCVRWT